MKKTISALFLASWLALTTASVALADASEEGQENGLPHACVHGIVAVMNPNCGFDE
jgi:hypothetical protein